jgi:hypothetical protein
MKITQVPLCSTGAGSVMPAHRHAGPTNIRISVDEYVRRDSVERAPEVERVPITDPLQDPDAAYPRTKPPVLNLESRYGL